MEPRYEELFTLVRSELQRRGFENLIAAGIVLTGGSSKMEGAIELAEEIFHMPVRIGVPQFVTGLSDVVKNPIYSTGVGLLLFGQRQVRESIHSSQLDSGFRGVFERMKSWFQVNF